MARASQKVIEQSLRVEIVELWAEIDRLRVETAALKRENATVEREEAVMDGDNKRLWKALNDERKRTLWSHIRERIGV